MSNQETYDRIRELKRIVAQQNGLDKGYDNYFFLGRIGSNYNEYGFNWEPFRDMAGPRDAGEGALPILIISDAQPHQVPEQSKVQVPMPHYPIRVSPSLGAAFIACMWLDLLVDNHALHGYYQGPFDWCGRGAVAFANALCEEGPF